jgi:alpha-tubulin suppressor-like RCC1 family protein
VFAVHPATAETATTDGWGWSNLAQLGDGATVDRSAPTPVAGPTGASSLAGGVGHSLALDDGGGVYAWGWNGVGQIGDGTTTDRQQPAQVAGLTDVSAVAGGYYHSLSVAGGTIKAWG